MGDSSLFHEWAVTIGTTATALFTGIMALISWLSSRRKIIVEFDYNYYDRDGISCIITIRNNRLQSIRPQTIRVAGRGITDVQPKSKNKHESWDQYTAPFSGHKAIAPANSLSYEFIVSVDWQEMLSEQKRPLSRLRSALSHLWRVKNSTVLSNSASANLMINCGSRFRFKKIKRTIVIPLSAIEKRAARSNQKVKD